MTYRLFATTPKAMEGILADEILALGAENVQSKMAGVAFQGDLAMAYKACLWLRTASRVLLLLEVQEVGEDNTEIQRELAMVSDTNGVFGGPQTVITAAEGLQPGANQQKIYWDHRCVRLAEARPHHSLGFGGLYEY